MTTKESDRELLTLAAKAAGYVVHGFINDIFIVNFGEGERGAWDPLQDDGDAFRLAVSLGIEVIPDEGGYQTVVNFMIGRYGYNRFVEWDEHGDDRFAASRLAIVLAAAAIGKEK